MAAQNPGYVIAKKHTPQAWGFDALSGFPLTPSGLQVPIGQATLPGQDYADFSAPLPHAAKIPHVVVTVANSHTAGTDLAMIVGVVAYPPGSQIATIAAGAPTYAVFPATPLTVGPPDNSATYGYPNAFATGVTGLFATPASVDIIGGVTSHTYTLVPDVAETVYPAGTIFGTGIAMASGAGSVVATVTALIQYLDTAIATDSANPTDW